MAGEACCRAVLTVSPYRLRWRRHCYPGHGFTTLVACQAFIPAITQVGAKGIFERILIIVSRTVQGVTGLTRHHRANFKSAPCGLDFVSPFRSVILSLDIIERIQAASVMALEAYPEVSGSISGFPVIIYSSQGFYTNPRGAISRPVDIMAVGTLACLACHTGQFRIGVQTAYQAMF